MRRLSLWMILVLVFLVRSISSVAYAQFGVQDAHSFDLIYKISLKKQVDSVALSADGRFLAYTTNDRVCLHEISIKRAILDSLKSESGTSFVAVAPEGRTLVTATLHGFPDFYIDRTSKREISPNLRKNSLGTGKATEGQLRRQIIGYPSLPVLVFRNEPGPTPTCVVESWQADKRNKTEVLLTTRMPIFSLGLNNTGDRVHLLGANLEGLWWPTVSTAVTRIDKGNLDAFETKKEYRVVEFNDPYPSSSTSFSLDARRFATLKGSNREGGIMLGLSKGPDIGASMLDPKGVSTAPWAVAISPDGRWCATVGEGRMISLWNVEARTFERAIPASLPTRGLAFMSYVAFSSDSNHIICVGSDRIVRCLDRVKGSLHVYGVLDQYDVRASSVVGGSLIVVTGGHALTGWNWNTTSGTPLPSKESILDQQLSLYVYQSKNIHE